MDFELLNKISIGLDIATAVSIIGAVFVFIYNIKKENKKKIGEERERERVIRLLNKQEHFSKLIEKYINTITSAKPEPELLENIKNLYFFLKNDLWSSFVILAREDDLENIEQMLKEIEGIASSINQNNHFNPRDFATKLVKLEQSVMIQIRQLMTDESHTISEEIVKNYSTKKYRI